MKQLGQITVISNIRQICDLTQVCSFMPKSIDQHRASPDVSIDEHVRRRQLELAQSLEQKQAIYLDLKFWIILRDVAAGLRTAAQEIELLHLLRKLVAGGKAICPISDSTFVEVFKHRDSRTRKATADLIDELSQGVTIIPFELRVGTELAHFIHSIANPDSVYPLDHLVWSKLSYVLGYVHPSCTEFDRETELAMQKAFFDHMWVIPLSEMVERIGEAMPADLVSFESLAARLNNGNAEHTAELRSFEHTYSLEIQGAIDLFAGRAADIVGEMSRKAVGSSMNRGSAEWRVQEQQWKNLLIAAFKKDATKDALRTLHINTCLHAFVRWNKSQQLEANDFFDFRHASAALGYCDAFLTERPLRAMVTAKNIALDKRYGCRVISEVAEAVEFLKSLD